MVRDKDIAQAVEGNARGYQLLRHSVTAVNQVRNVVDQEQGGGIAAARFADAWSTFRAEQHDARGIFRLTESSAI
jgi:hypothetical protein